MIPCFREAVWPWRLRMEQQRHSRRSLLQGLSDLVRRITGHQHDPDFPADPYAYCPSPLRNGPGSRSGAAAVAEPEEENGFFSPGKP